MDKYSELVKDRGVQLKDKTGTLDWALKREDALAALQLLRQEARAVLGGDVVLEKDGKFYFIFHDRVQGTWHIDQRDNESAESYIARSIRETEDYIESYPEKSGGNYYYVLVPKGE